MGKRLTKKQRRAIFLFEHEQERREKRAEQARRKREERLQKLRDRERRRRAAAARHLAWLEYWRLHNRRGLPGAAYTADLFEEEPVKPEHRCGSLGDCAAGDGPAFTGLTPVSRRKSKAKSLKKLTRI
jgi:hypothetical protein